MWCFSRYISWVIFKALWISIFSPLSRLHEENIQSSYSILKPRVCDVARSIVVGSTSSKTRLQNFLLQQCLWSHAVCGWGIGFRALLGSVAPEGRLLRFGWWCVTPAKWGCSKRQAKVDCLRWNHRDGVRRRGRPCHVTSRKLHNFSVPQCPLWE